MVQPNCFEELIGLTRIKLISPDNRIGACILEEAPFNRSLPPIPTLSDYRHLGDKLHTLSFICLRL
jgi:hypothetical protein